MDYTLVFKWVKALPGREAQALEVLVDIRTFFGKLAAEGKVAEPLVLMSVNDGMLIVRGAMETMFDIINLDEYITLVDKALLVCEGFSYSSYFTGELMEHRLGLYIQAGRDLEVM